ncbi:MAG: alanine racemase [Pyrinomonadaceae bacterium]
MERPTIAKIDLDNLGFNFRSIRAFLGDGPRFMAVVKADAYGHGAVECARRLATEGADWLGVALLEEAVEIRGSGVETPILSFGGVWPDTADVFLNQRITPTVFDIEHARAIDRAAAARGDTVRIHVKIDTGMGRVGIPAADAAEFAGRLAELRSIEVEGLMGQFASADDPEQKEFTFTQIGLLHQASMAFRSKGLLPKLLHTANSAGAVVYGDSRVDMVRIGGLLYGVGSDIIPAGAAMPEVRPVMSITTRIAQLKQVPAGSTIGYGRSFVAERDSVIGTIAIGYHDGYRRCFSNRARVLVNEVFAPVVGRISMDWTTIDLTDVTGAEVGSEVVVLGHQGGSAVSAEDLGALAETISYEITCGIGKRVLRRYS